MKSHPISLFLLASIIFIVLCWWVIRGRAVLHSGDTDTWKSLCPPASSGVSTVKDREMLLKVLRESQEQLREGQCGVAVESAE